MSGSDGEAIMKCVEIVSRWPDQSEDGMQPFKMLRILSWTMIWQQ